MQSRLFSMAEMDADSLLADGVDFAGLAKAWGNDSRVVQALLKNGTLFEWPSKQTCGIVSFASLAMNYAVVDHLLDIWCCQVTAAKSIYIPHAKEQALLESFMFSTYVYMYVCVCVSLCVCLCFNSSPAVQILKLREDLSLDANEIRVNCDAVSLRAFMSYMVRRHDGARRKVSDLQVLDKLSCSAHAVV